MLPRIPFFLLIILFSQWANAQTPIRFYDENTWLYGYLTAEGDTLIPSSFCYAENFSNGYAIVTQCEEGIRTPSYKRTQNLIDEKGSILLELERNQFFPPGAKVGSSKIPVINPDQQYQYVMIDRSFDFPDQYEKAWSFGEGMAGVKKKDDPIIYLIDNLGYEKGQLPEDYTLPSGADKRFSNGLIPVMDRSSGKSGFMNKEGKLIIPCQFDIVGSFSEGKAYAAIITNTYMEHIGKNRVGYINLEGEWIIELSKKMTNLENGCFFQGTEFQNGKAEMCISENDGDCANYGCLWVDEEGKIIEEDWK